MYDPILDALRRGAVAEALTAAEALVADRPDDAQALRWLSTAQMQGGQPDAALASIDRAIALAPDNADLHLARAGVLVGSRRHEDAQAALSQATVLDPNQFTAYVIQGQLALGFPDQHHPVLHCRLASLVRLDRSPAPGRCCPAFDRLGRRRVVDGRGCAIAVGVARHRQCDELGTAGGRGAELHRADLG